MKILYWKEGLFIEMGPYCRPSCIASIVTIITTRPTSCIELPAYDGTTMEQWWNNDIVICQTWHCQHLVACWTLKCVLFTHLAHLMTTFFFQWHCIFYRSFNQHINRLVQERCKFIADALELLLSCTNLLIDQWLLMSPVTPHAA